MKIDYLIRILYKLLIQYDIIKNNIKNYYLLIKKFTTSE